MFLIFGISIRRDFHSFHSWTSDARRMLGLDKFVQVNRLAKRFRDCSLL